jgi:hypothetical protein
MFVASSRFIVLFSADCPITTESNASIPFAHRAYPSDQVLHHNAL